MDDILQTIRDFWDDHKTGIIITIVVILLAIIGYVVFTIMYDPLKITWSGEGSEIVATEPTKLNITAKVYNKKTEYNIQWSANGGNVTLVSKNTVAWQLPEKEGTYELVATCGEKKFVKKVTVLKNPLINYLDYQTAPVQYVDSDGDGLTDIYETQVSLTDSKLEDSDGDTILDGDELELGLDPLKEMSDGKTLDSERVLNYTYNDTKLNVEIALTGKGNLTKTTVDSYKTETLLQVSAVVSNIYILHTESDMQSANIKFKYDKQQVKNKGIAESNLSVYKFNSDDNKFEKLDSSVDESNSTISINVKELGKYFIADSSKMQSNLQTNLMFVIDNSGSMYSPQEVEGSSGNDINFQRVELSNRIIDKLKGDYKFGAGKFTFNYNNLIGLTDDKEATKKKISGIKTDIEKFTGTYIGEALSGGLGQFNTTTNDLSRNYLLLLTDGKDTTTIAGYDKDKLTSAVSDAVAKNVKVITIGLGNEVDKKVLEDIAVKTNGKFYYAANASALEDIFNSIAIFLNYNLVDSNLDYEDDSISLYNSEFLANRDGFSFPNFSNTVQNSGATYGMSLISKLYYEKRLPMKMSDISYKIGEATVSASGFDLGSVSKIKGYNEPLSEVIFTDLKDFSTPWKLRSSQVTKKALPLKTAAKQLLVSKGFTTYYQAYTKGDASFNQYENIMLDLASQAYQTTLNSSDRQLINAFYRFDVIKYKSTMYNFTEDSAIAMAKLADSLENKQPTLLVLNNTYTVLATKLICDVNNPNIMKIEVYDSNVSGSARYIDVERVKMNTIKNSNQKINKYEYKFKYDDKQVYIGINIANLDANL